MEEHFDVLSCAIAREYQSWCMDFLRILAISIDYECTLRVAVDHMNDLYPRLRMFTNESDNHKIFDDPVYPELVAASDHIFNEYQKSLLLISVGNRLAQITKNNVHH